MLTVYCYTDTDRHTQTDRQTDRHTGPSTPPSTPPPPPPPPSDFDVYYDHEQEHFFKSFGDKWKTYQSPHSERRYSSQSMCTCSGHALGNCTFHRSDRGSSYSWLQLQLIQQIWELRKLVFFVCSRAEGSKRFCSFLFFKWNPAQLWIY